ncbi:tellurite resistance TerB family protein [Winogradskyella alexanderae]|uniref:TerB family tellurite resistance protein n=1 Tax=Winogradskyella alexanderae TaxID=2877123 RepID=A0ABS7XVC2_9FLAO|nr:TerB family tellurite resistance protein [Winogradskyella alexanderae]MCA0133388.1 TerB family tellurite resistance protein [Winogradskyella alexanderae]
MNIEFYKNIGTLFYAIAKADDNLAFEEYTKLTDCLERDWNLFETSTVEIIKEQFNHLQSQDKLASDCFDSFVDFLHQNPELFDSELKSLILKTANDIAYAFSKINKSELTYVAKLNIEFKKT